MKGDNDLEKITKFRGGYFFLSNFYQVRVPLDGMVFPTVEHAYQAAKSLNYHDRVRVRNAVTPGKAKRLGRGLKLREDWDEVKLQIMEDLLRYKFRFGSELADRLVATGGAKIVEENDWGDEFWGVCRGKGDNHLGKLLMEIRDDLREMGGQHRVHENGNEGETGSRLLGEPIPERSP